LGDWLRGASTGFHSLKSILQWIDSFNHPETAVHNVAAKRREMQVLRRFCRSFFMIFFNCNSLVGRRSCLERGQRKYRCHVKAAGLKLRIEVLEQDNRGLSEAKVLRPQTQEGPACQAIWVSCCSCRSAEWIKGDGGLSARGLMRTSNRYLPWPHHVLVCLDLRHSSVDPRHICRLWVDYFELAY
jgi:hypothetical protein